MSSFLNQFNKGLEKGIEKIGVTAGSLITGNFESTGTGGSITSYSNTGPTTFNFLSSSFNVQVTKAQHFASAMGASVHIMDGNFSGTLVDPSDSSREVSVNGSFSGVAVGSN